MEDRIGNVRIMIGDRGDGERSIFLSLGFSQK